MDNKQTYNLYAYEYVQPKTRLECSQGSRAYVHFVTIRRKWEGINKPDIVLKQVRFNSDDSTRAPSGTMPEVPAKTE